MMQDTVRVAAGQFAVPPFDVDAAIEVACHAIDEAANSGVELLVLPETFVGGYPYWRGHVTVAQETELSARLYESSIAPGDAAVQTLESAARRRGVAVVIGANERDLTPGSCSYFNSQLLFDPDYGYLGSHRKLVPTHTERAYWAAGGVDDVRVDEFSFANVGSLICYEHHMLPARLALLLAGEEIHCAAWPGYWETGEHIAVKHPGPVDRYGEIDVLVRNYAMSSQCFVVSANAYVPDSTLTDELREIMGYNLARGGSAVVDPSGRYLALPKVDEEGLVVADCDPASRHLAKAYLDTAGHYTRWDVFEFGLRGGAPLQPRPRARRHDDAPANASVDRGDDDAASLERQPHDDRSPEGRRSPD